MKYLLLISLFFVTITVAYSQEESRAHDRNYVIKYGLFQPFLAGEIPFSFEHAVSPIISYEITAGLTISQLSNLSSRPDLFNANGPSGERTPHFGFVLQAGLRIYPIKSNNAPKGFFLAPEIKFRQYNIDFYKKGEQFANKFERRPFNQFIARFNIGYQFILKNAFALDLFGGVGFNNRFGTFIDVVSKYDSSTDSYYTTSEDYHFNKVIPHINIGIRVGYAGKFK